MKTDTLVMAALVMPHFLKEAVQYSEGSYEARINSAAACAVDCAEALIAEVEKREQQRKETKS